MKYPFFPVIALVILASLTGCNLPAGGACDSSGLVAPAQTSPANFAVVGSLTPTLSWTSTNGSGPYPYNDCYPAGYHVTLERAVGGLGDLGANAYGPHTLSWAPLTPLMPHSEYHWGVNAFSPSGDGPYAGDRVFFTGPICNTAALIAPSQHNPRNGEIVTTLRPTLDWIYPDACIPQGYRIDLSTEAAFADTSLSGGTGNPSTRWSPGSDLTDCTLYYWRVAAINDTTLGPFSITRNFFVDTGACVYPLPPIIVAPLITIVPSVPPFEFILDRNGNCRYGPSQLFGIYTSFFAGQSLEIQGRNDDASWLYAKTPDNEFCWISIAVGSYNGNPQDLPFVPSDPLPTEAPTPTKRPTRQAPTYNSCSDYPSQDICKADPENFGGCYWSPNNVCDQLK